MRPTYLNKKEVSEEVKAKLMEQGPGDRALWKMYNQEVLMEQELATSEESMKVKELIREREADLGVALTIQEWAYFNIRS